MRQFYVTWFTRMVGGVLMVSLVACANKRLAPLEHATYRTHINQATATHQVQAGETLYAIAWRYDQDYRDLARYNGLTEPFAIQTGQTIYLARQHQPKSMATTGTPVSATQKPNSQKTSSAPTKPPTTRSQKISPPSTKQPTQRSQKTSPSPIKQSARQSQKASSASIKQSTPGSKTSTKAVHKTNASLTWQWPTQGELIRRFAPSQGDKGIKIAGRAGQAIKAAADGVVAYSGSGLRGYGQLLIIKHSQDYLSAYAHNRKLLVKEGDVVKAGQTIAEMGHSEAAQVMLHFEIRKAGEPKDPLLYLRQIG